MSLRVPSASQTHSQALQGALSEAALLQRKHFVTAQILTADPASGSKSWTGLITQQAAC